MKRTTVNQEDIAKWINEVGEQEAAKKLIDEGVALSLVQKIVSGKYPRQPRTLLKRAIERAMAATEEAS